jgi:hypothetical protein
MEEQETQTWTVVVMGHGFWGCGNSYVEAAGNAPHFRPEKDEHILVLFTEPVTHVSAGLNGLYYKWAGDEGAMAHTTIKNGLNEVIEGESE